ncbi:MAG: N-acetylmuramoyl-L-alanine amidase [Notoacmeibacter sp.]|nr:N-acetylmuramoyl-L-alanine amidase [Notoacmeibacter sp.]
MTGFPPDFPEAEVRASPNFGPRRDDKGVSIILLHYTGMEDGPCAENWLCSHESEVSSHYIVHEDGRVVQMVRESDRAWHAGASCWEGETDINSVSVGIEIVNSGHPAGLPAFPDAQIEAVIRLCRHIQERHNVALHHVLAHSDVSPGRKCDPGEAFPWERLAAAGVGLMSGAVDGSSRSILAPGDEGAGVEELQSMLSLYGYLIDINGNYDERTRVVIEAFQRHFRRSAVTGIADGETQAILSSLLDLVPGAYG